MGSIDTSCPARHYDVRTKVELIQEENGCAMFLSDFELHRQKHLVVIYKINAFV